MVHPQSIIHSMVEFVDGSIVAQLGTADMRQPIQYALTYPDRLSSPVPALDWTTISRLDLIPPDKEKFPCISLAYSAMEIGGTAPAVLNAADEIAVEAFLERRIRFTDIPRLVAAALEAHCTKPANSLEDVIAADQWARNHVRESVLG
jgi:1-deoxy-D-xylulose-5-phosphate reductoisomerase